jgi:hypothetical protein
MKADMSRWDSEKNLSGKPPLHPPLPLVVHPVSSSFLAPEAPSLPLLPFTVPKDLLAPISGLGDIGGVSELRIISNYKKQQQEKK